MAKSNPVNDNIIDLDLSVTKRKKFRFDGDDNRILELNTSDFGIVSRISEVYPKLETLQEKASKVMEGITDDETDEEMVANMKEVGERLSTIDKEMRDLIDYMFDSNVSEITAPHGSMYDPFEGSFRFNYIITLLMKQYEDNLQAEFSKMEKQVKSHTDKYTRKR